MRLRKRCIISICVLGLLFQGCVAGGGGDEEEVKQKEPGIVTRTEVTQAGPYKYSVYLENSGSLNGYLNVSGDGSFRDAVYSLITGINGFREKQTLNLYDVNTVVIPVAQNADAAQVNDYISNLDAATFKKRSEASGGNQAKSDLRDVFRKVLDSTAGNTVSLLISDCIFSPEGGDALNYLSQQKAGIQGFFQEKLAREPFATLVLQFSSGFSGAYYYQDNTPITASFTSRPHYITCVGPEQALRDLLGFVEEKFQSKGYRNFLFLTPQKSYNVHPAIIMNTAYYNYEPDKPMVITDPQQGGADGRFRIKLKAGFSELPVREAYLLDRANYECTPGYTVESIKAQRNEQGSGSTHEIILVSAKPVSGNVSLALNTRLPDWVGATNLDADKGLAPEALEGKTFGMRYLVSGMYDAYYTRESKPQYFTISITVKD